MHECEPELGELRDIERALFKAESTDENMKKLAAIQSQIKRHEKEEEEDGQQRSEAGEAGDIAHTGREA